MGLLETISIDELTAALETVERKKPTQRLMIAILYKQGPSVPMIADWFDMREQTLYRWLRSMENEPLLDAIHDEPPPGRPSKLTEDERDKFETVLQSPPAEIGYEASTWTPSLASQYLREECGVNYTSRHVRRLLNEVGITTASSRTSSHDNDEHIDDTNQ